MAKQIFQDLIDAKDWNSLADTDFLEEFNYHNYGWELYTFDKKLVLQFFCKNARYLKSKKHVERLHGSLYEDDIWGNLNTAMIRQGITLDESEWEEYLINVYTMFKHNTIRGPGLQRAIAGKEDINFYKALSKSPVRKDLSGFLISVRNTKIVITPEWQELTPKEFRSLLFVYDQAKNTYIKYKNCDKTIYQHCIDDDIDIVEFVKKYDLEISDIYDNLSIDEYIDVIRYIKSKYTDKMEASLIGDYFKNHYEENISDDMIETLLNEFSGIMYGISFCLSKEQYEKYKDLIPSSVKVKLPYLSLDEAAEDISGLEDMSGERFFTEEEMIAHPNLFDPNEVKYLTCMYVSKETFALLNKTWNKDIRYNKVLTDVRVLIDSMSSTFYNIESLRYIREKTKTSKSDFAKLILKHAAPEKFRMRNDDMIKVEKLKTLIGLNY